MSKSKSGWLLYLMIHVPGVWRFKVGITSLSIGASKRAKSIDKEMFGFPVPIMILPLPGAYFVEQEMHRVMRRWNTRFTKASGKTEWFILMPLFYTLPIMLTIWAVYLFIFDQICGTKALPVVAGWFFDIIFYFVL